MCKKIYFSQWTRLTRGREALVIALFLSVSAWVHATDLNDIYRIALSEDPQFKQVAASNLATQELRNQARANLFLPSLSFDASIEKNFQDITLPQITQGGAGQGGDIDFTSRNYALNLTQPIFHYDRFMALKQSDISIRQAALEVDAAYQDLMVRAAERYFDVLAAADNLTFARAEAKALDRQLEQSNERFAVGLIAITDVQEAQAGYDLSIADKIQAQNELDNSREALREVTNSYMENLKTLGDMPLVSPDPENIDAWTDKALSQNLNLAAAQATMEVSQADIRIQHAGHFPALDLVAGLSKDDSGGRFGQTDIETGSVGIRLNVPIYEGGQVTSRTREAIHRYDEALEQFEQQRRLTQRETRNAYLGVISGISRVKALRQAVTSNETSVESTQAGFAVGTRTAVDVVNVERELLRARADYAQARYDYILNTLRLKQGAGTLSPEDLNQINSWLTE